MPPKVYAGADAPKEMLDLVGRLMHLLLAGESPASAALRDQYARAKIERLELTGVGFFVDFGVSPEAPCAGPKDFAGGHVNIEVEGVEHGAGCLLFVRGGVIATLEGYTYGEEWPERPAAISLTESVPLVPSRPAAPAR